MMTMMMMIMINYDYDYESDYANDDDIYFDNYVDL